MDSKPEAENDFREGDTSTTKAPDPVNTKYGGITKLRNFLAPKRLELGMWVSRLLTIYFSIFVIIPLFGNAMEEFRRALLASAITSCIRLFQRLPRPYTLSLAFFSQLSREDSCHYLWYSIMFLYFSPISFALIPPMFIATLHVASFSFQMVESVQGPMCMARGLGSFLHIWVGQTGKILKITASAEVVLMGMILLNCFRGTIGLIAPIAYYRFLALRYGSKRNPYTKTVFYEMRMALEAFIGGPACPRFIAGMLRMVINLVCKLAPASSPT